MIGFSIIRRNSIFKNEKSFSPRVEYDVFFVNLTDMNEPMTYASQSYLAGAYEKNIFFIRRQRFPSFR